MLKILKSLGLPNVMSFELTDPEYNKIALLSGFTIKERSFRATSKIQRISRANRYLAKQFKRLERAAKAENYELFNYLGRKLLQKSNAYLVYSFNGVMPKWTSMNIRKAFNLLISAHKLRSKLETDIDYKRVWIDKKPGDYGRPLGVPTASWRIYLRMVTHIGEIFAKGRDLYSPHQHGGRPGYGVMTCLKDVAEMLEKFPRVYEFDLKGFFDHISHESMTTIFKNTFLENLYKAMCQAKPKSYVLPKITADIAASRYEHIRRTCPELLDEPWTRGLDPTDMGFIIYPGNYDQLMEYLVENNISVDQWDNYVPTEEVDAWDRTAASKMPMNIENQYKTLMNEPQNFSNRLWDSFAGIRPMEDIKESQRNIGRDKWKDLDLPEQGVPQGSSFGPFLSSLAAAVYLRKEGVKDWKMYIDDGLVFNYDDSDLKDKLVRTEKALKRMTVEFEPSKSRLHTRESLMSNSMKFLGIRFKNMSKVRNFFTISSDTRSGTTRELPELNRENILIILENLYNDGLITMSKYRLAKWAVVSSKLGQVIGANQVNLAIRYGYFGYLLSWLYNPEADITELKAKIRIGVETATAKILKQEKSWGSVVLNASAWTYKDTGGIVKIVKPDLNNHSSICVDLLLETLTDGFVSLREFGLVNKSNRKPIYSNVIGFKGAKYNAVPQSPYIEGYRASYASMIYEGSKDVTIIDSKGTIEERY